VTKTPYRRQLRALSWRVGTRRQRSDGGDMVGLDGVPRTEKEAEEQDRPGHDVTPPAPPPLAAREGSRTTHPSLRR